jgi:hypothetical protein
MAIGQVVFFFSSDLSIGPAFEVCSRFAQKQLEKIGEKKYDSGRNRFQELSRNQVGERVGHVPSNVNF